LPQLSKDVCAAKYLFWAAERRQDKENAMSDAGVILAKYPMTEEDKRTLENIFTYHAPKDDQAERYTDIRAEAKALATLIMSLCPRCRERSLALTKLEEAIFWANASIARNE
jgi:hypothetical protein